MWTFYSHTLPFLSAILTCVWQYRLKVYWSKIICYLNCKSIWFLVTAIKVSLKIRELFFISLFLRSNGLKWLSFSGLGWNAFVYRGRKLLYVCEYVCDVWQLLEKLNVYETWGWKESGVSSYRMGYGKHRGLQVGLKMFHYVWMPCNGQPVDKILLVILINGRIFY